MSELFRAAFVIARRDYVASVWSRTFLLFLLGPLLPVLAGALFGIVGMNVDRQTGRPAVAAVADAGDAALLREAHTRLSLRLGGSALPRLTVTAPQADGARQVRDLLADREAGVTAVAHGALDAPVLVGPEGAIGETRGDVALLYDEARALRQMGAAAPSPVALRTEAVGQAAGNDASARAATARIGQMVLMLLVMLLAGMMLSNLLEEKSNKVIEVLAAAVPVDAIFVGKIAAMLAMSLTGIVVWGTIGVTGALLLAPEMFGALPPPAVGWPAFLALGVLYFVACYLLLGGLYLGIGAQAGSVREVQSLSLPVTMAQIGVVALAGTVVASPDGGLAKAAMIFPWSSPFAMLARAAQSGDVLPHLLALGWQALWVALIVRFAAVRFRRSVLKSGPVPKKSRVARA